MNNEFIPLMSGAKPNKHGVFDEESSGVESMQYDGRMSEAQIYVAQLQSGQWISSAFDCHYQGSKEASLTPLSVNGPHFRTKEKAIQNMAKCIVERQGRIEQEQDSVVTEKQRKEAKVMKEWAERLIRPFRQLELF